MSDPQCDSDDDIDGDTHSTDDSGLFGLDQRSSDIEILKVLIQQSFPLMISFFLDMGGGMVNLVFAGRLVKKGDASAVFAGISLATLFINFTWYSLISGMSSAVETLGSQHNGSGNYREVGIIFQRCCAVLAVLGLPIVALWFFSYDIYRIFGVEHRVCDVVRGYLSIRLLSMPADIFMESYEKYLMSVGVMEPSMWSLVVFVPLLAFMDFVFVVQLGLGYQYLAVSWVLSSYFVSLLWVALSWSNPAVKRTLQPPSWEAWIKWPEFIRLGIPGTVMLCSEWWAYEILTLFATQLGTVHVAAQSILLQLGYTAFMLPMALGVTAASLVGNCIGAEQHFVAQRVGRLSLYFACSLEGIICSAVYLLGPVIIGVFTDDEEVRHLAEKVLPVMSVCTALDGILGVGAGVLRGVGRQSIGAVANVVAYYIVGLPLAWIACFKLGFDLLGLMLGITVGSLGQALSFLVLILGYEEYVYGAPTKLLHRNTDAIDSRDQLLPLSIELSKLSDVDL